MTDAQAMVARSNLFMWISPERDVANDNRVAAMLCLFGVEADSHFSTSCRRTLKERLQAAWPNFTQRQQRKNMKCRRIIEFPFHLQERVTCGNIVENALNHRRDGR